LDLNQNNPLKYNCFDFFSIFIIIIIANNLNSIFGCIFFWFYNTWIFLKCFIAIMNYFFFWKSIQKDPLVPFVFFSCWIVLGPLFLSEPINNQQVFLFSPSSSYYFKWFEFCSPFGIIPPTNMHDYTPFHWFFCFVLCPTHPLKRRLFSGFILSTNSVPFISLLPWCILKPPGIFFFRKYELYCLPFHLLSQFLF